MRADRSDVRTLAARVAAKVSAPAAALVGEGDPSDPGDTREAKRDGARRASSPARRVLPHAAARAPAAPRTIGLRKARPGDALMLMPGELYFGAEAQQVKTLLGSCVALTLWHPKRRIGGMCHYLLPSRQRAIDVAPDGRFGDEAVAELVAQLQQHGCSGSDFVAHLYGGADTMAGEAGVKFNVGERNIECGWWLVEQYGFTLDGVDVGDNMPRTVTLELASGAVECRRGTPY